MHTMSAFLGLGVLKPIWDWSSKQKSSVGHQGSAPSHEALLLGSQELHVPGEGSLTLSGPQPASPTRQPPR